jgi:hypothetical protein
VIFCNNFKKYDHRRREGAARGQITRCAPDFPVSTALMQSLTKASYKMDIPLRSVLGESDRKWGDLNR